MFGPEAAKVYDRFYPLTDAEKSAVFFGLGAGTAQGVLDVGCGTGRYLELFTHWPAYNDTPLFGVDLSESMLAIARQKVPRATFLQGAAETFSIEEPVGISRRFRSVLMMGDIISYHTDQQDIVNVFRNIHWHMHPRGRFIFDCWYGPTVLTHGSDTRVRTVGDVTRTAVGTLSPIANEYSVAIKLERAGEVVSEEEHRLRFFFMPELSEWLHHSGFKLLYIGKPTDYLVPLTNHDWHALLVAERQ